VAATAEPHPEDGVAALGRLLAAAPDAIADPWPIWHGLRERGPVVEAAGAYWITRHAEVKAVFRDDVRFSSDARRQGTRADHLRSQMTSAQRSAFDELAEFRSLFVVMTDGAAHDRLRRIAHRAFTPRRIAELEAATTRYVTQLLDELAEQDEPDLMQLSFRLPLMIIGDLLGVPDADRRQIKEWSDTWYEHATTPDDRIFRSLRAMRDFRAYVEAMLDEHRTAPDVTSLVAALVGAEHDERLTADELAAMFFVLIFAGHETTTNLIGTGTYELLRNRSQWELLRADPARTPQAVEELLRHVSPVQWNNRLALVDVTVGDTTIPAGATVLPSPACANRDERVFEEPDRLDLRRRDAGQHLAFGFGKHFCLGASLARLEAAVAIGALATRFPQLELATDTVTWRGAPSLRGLAALPVRLGRPRS
jgi:cytochrome P450